MMDPTPEQLADLARIIAATADDEIDCDELLERVAAYLDLADTDGVLPDELEKVRQHLAVCPQCREEFDALVRARDDADASSG